MRPAHAAPAPRESAPSSRKTHASDPLFGALERYGAHRPRPHGDALHAGGGSGENVELEPMEREPLTRSGNTPQRLHEQPRHGLDPAGRQRDTERLLEPAGRGASLKLDDPYWGLVERGRAARLEDLRHEVAKEVLERDQARRSAKASTPDTTAISSADASASVSAFVSTAASVVRVEGSRHGTKGANARPSFSSRGAACATIGSAQRRPSTRGTRYAALTSSGMPSARVKTPSTVGVVRARSAGIAAAAQMIPTVVRAFAVASTRPGFSSTPAAPPAPRSLYDTQRVSSSWLTAAAATPMAADAAATINPNSSSTAGRVTVASAAARWSRGVGLPAPRRPDSHRASARRRRGARAPAPSRRAHPPSRPPDARTGALAPVKGRRA